MRNKGASAAILCLFHAVVLAGLLVPFTLQAGMTDYCSVPPYVVQNIQPNVMVVVDVSGSMFNTAYYDGFHTVTTTDDNPCTSSSSRCSGFTNPGTYPAYKYYGYFNPDYWYTYGSSKFSQSVAKTARAKSGTEWDGNFLNWLTMRRTDILRKVLTGGDKQGGEASGWDRLIGEAPDDDSRGVYMSIANASTVSPFTGARNFTFYTGSGTSVFNVSGSGGGDYNVSVVVPAPVTGVLQDVVGARARVGLTIYNSATGTSSRGGRVVVPVTSGSLSSMVSTINTTRPVSNTPPETSPRRFGRSRDTLPKMRACSAAGPARDTNPATLPSRTATTR
jgi:type IV pilus assembly protein PilY1